MCAWVWCIKGDGWGWCMGVRWVCMWVQCVGWGGVVWDRYMGVVLGVG